MENYFSLIEESEYRSKTATGFESIVDVEFTKPSDPTLSKGGKGDFLMFSKNPPVKWPSPCTA